MLKYKIPQIVTLTRNHTMLIVEFIKFLVDKHS